MGVDEALFQSPSENPLYDIVYCGSIAGRNGLIEALRRLAGNYKVVVVGQVSDLERSLLKHENITILGRVERSNLPEIYRNARFGLNYTPNIYPFNIQTSTKTLEYLASGLGVISNRYYWSEEFFRNLKYTPLWIEGDLSLEENHEQKLDFSSFSWSSILNDCKFEEFILDLIYD